LTSPPDLIKCTLTKIKIFSEENMRNKINMMTLSQKDLKESKAGSIKSTNCWCACWYEGLPGGSTTTANGHANDAGHLSSPDLNPTL